VVKMPRHFMGAAFATLALFAAGCAPSALVILNDRYDPTAVKRVAMIDFEDQPAYIGSGKVSSAIFEKYLFLSGYDIVDRRQADAALSAMNLQTADALDLDTLRALGQRLGVDAIVLGQVTDYTDATDKTVMETMAMEQSSPIYSHVDTVQTAGNAVVHTHQEVLTGYSTSTVDQPVQQTETVMAHVGLSVRMVDIHTGEVLWSASAAADGSHLTEATEKASLRIQSALRDRLKEAGL